MTLFSSVMALYFNYRPFQWKGGDGILPVIMQIASKIKTNFSEIGESIKRFPLTLLVSTTMVVLIILLNEDISFADATRRQLERILQALAIGLPLTISFKLLLEGLEKRTSFAPLLVALPVSFLSVLYYLLFTSDMHRENVIRFMATLFFGIVSVFVAQRIRNKRNFELFTIRVLYAFFLTVLYSGVLYFGVSAIIFTINALFDANIDGKYYFYFFLVIALVFAAALFLSKFPKQEDTFEDYPYSKALKVLLLYIVIPLISIYTLILYVYFSKILITWEWPRGLVSNLVVWYAVLSIIVMYFLTPVIQENAFARSFRRFFPFLLLPILVMMFLSIGLRINQYGFTENRYFIVILGIWVTLVLGYLALTLKTINWFIPASVLLFVLIAIYSPLSAFSVSHRSQNNRLESVLIVNDMLVDGVIVPSNQVSQEDRRQISSIINYFDARDMEKLRYVPEDFSYAKMESVFGFPFEYDFEVPRQSYFYLFNELSNQTIPVEGFSYMVEGHRHAAGRLTILDDLSHEYHRGSDTIRIREGEVLLMEIEIQPIADILTASLEGGMEKDQRLTLENASFDFENDRVVSRLIITALNGEMTNNGEPRVDGISYRLLLRIKP